MPSLRSPCIALTCSRQHRFIAYRNVYFIMCSVQATANVNERTDDNVWRTLNYIIYTRTHTSMRSHCRVHICNHINKFMIFVSFVRVNIFRMHLVRICSGKEVRRRWLKCCYSGNNNDNIHARCESDTVAMWARSTSAIILPSGATPVCVPAPHKARSNFRRVRFCCI